MKLAHCVLVGLCMSAVVVVRGQDHNKTDRIVKTPQSFVKAGPFLEMKEADRILYASGLMDGFFASAFWGASDETVAFLASCTRGMTDKQVSAIIVKYV